MNPALLFLIRRSARNALREKVRRLKSPRYLVPTILGAAYFFLVFDPFGLRDRRHRFAPEVPAGPDLDLAWEISIAAAILLFASLSWILPVRGSPLAFVEAEVAHLFPAPVTRKDLVRFKLLDLQKYYLFLPVIIGLLNIASRGPARAAMIGLGTWLAFNVATLHQIGAKMTRLSLAEHGWSGLRRALLPLLAVAAYVAFLVLAAPPLPADLRLDHLGRDLSDWFAAVDRGPAGWALLPFRLLVRPFLADDLGAFLPAAGGLALVLVVLYLWVMRTDVAFEEAAAAQAENLSRRIEAAKKGKFSSGEPAKAARRNPFPLAPTGPPEAAFVWKSVAESLRGLSVRFVLLMVTFAAIGIPLSLGMVRKAGNTGPALLAAAAIGMGICAAGLVFMGPSVAGANLRSDMERVEVLKTFPLTGARLVRCSLAGTLVPVAALQALLVIGAALLFPSFGKAEVTPAWRIAVGLAGVLALPALTGISAAVDAAGVLYFPSWVKPGQVAAQGGMEGMGYGIVTSVMKILAFAVGLLVPGGVGALVAFVLVAAGGPIWAPAGVILGALFGSALVWVEVWLVTLVFGRRFEAFDPAEEGLVT